MLTLSLSFYLSRERRPVLSFLNTRARGPYIVLVSYCIWSLIVYGTVLNTFPMGTLEQHKDFFSRICTITAIGLQCT